MEQMTYEQKQIIALRTLVGVIYKVLNDEQKTAINGLVSNPPEMPAGISPEQAINAKEIYAEMKDIISGDAS
ncbi:MAG: hypothetical protein E6556_03555 [Pantoea sp.]|nr:hypothetical protein [Pantoea sp.]